MAGKPVDTGRQAHPVPGRQAAVDQVRVDAQQQKLEPGEHAALVRREFSHEGIVHDFLRTRQTSGEATTRT